MATGIVAITAYLDGLTLIAMALGWLNVLAFVVLWLMILARIIFYRRDMFLDLVDHRRGVGFFTVVTGAAVLGADAMVLFGHYRAALALWFLAALLWMLLTYASFAAFTVKQQKPTLAEEINGGWLIAVVATEAVS